MTPLTSLGGWSLTQLTKLVLLCCSTIYSDLLVSGDVAYLSEAPTSKTETVVELSSETFLAVSPSSSQINRPYLYCSNGLSISTASWSTRWKLLCNAASQVLPSKRSRAIEYEHPIPNCLNPYPFRDFMDDFD